MTEFASRLQAALGSGYRVERELGGGGMSRVFVAQEVALGRQVVVKVLPPELAAGVSIDRFRREIQLAASLQHPHIVPLLTAGHADDLTYYVMPLIEGESLRTRLARVGELPIGEAVRLFRDVVDALAYAHSHGVVHRDIKPDNVLLSGSHAVVTDFGVAKAISESAGQSSLTSAGVALGTPAYMAPEQATADPHTDHRADIYAVGALAYETLAGRPPFTGSSPQAVLAAHVTEVPEPLVRHRPTVPPALAEIVMRCLAKKPADRWQSAPELLQQLESMVTPTAGTTPLPSAGRRRRALPLVIGAVVVATVIGALILSRSSKRPALDPNLLVVAPFDVLDPALALWHEGLVDVLSRNLDGAGPIRTVSPTVVIRRWSGRADPTSAAELGRLTGAGLAVFGQLVSTGSESVRLKATVLDVTTRRSIGEVELRDQSAQMDRLADSATVALLRELSRTRPIGAVRLGSLGSSSLPAMKAFLQGEQFFRRAAWDSASASYRRALTYDSGFALALRRVAITLGWQRVGTDSLSRAYNLRAGALNHGLGPRDSLLVLADSLSAVAMGYASDLDWWRLVRRLMATLEEAARRYPDDPEVWYALGDARDHLGHFGRGIAATDREILEPFDRAIALDSAFAPAYIHPVELALGRSDAAAGRRYAEKYLALAPTDVEGSGIRLAATMFDPRRDRAAEAARLLDTASADLLFSARLSVRAWPDSAETQVRLARLLAAGRRGTYPLFTDSVISRRGLSRALAYRGHVREAYRVGSTPRVLAELAQVGVVPPDTAAAAFAKWLRTDLSAAVYALPWWAARGDTASLSVFARKADSVATSGPIRIESAFGDAPRIARSQAVYAGASARAYLALARRDTADAIRRFDAAPDTMCALCAHYDLWHKTDLLAARGRDRDAATLLESQPPFFSALAPGMLALQRGRVRERLGDRAKAIEAYGFVTDVWRFADPELQPFVDEAKAALRRLSGEPRR